MISQWTFIFPCSYTSSNSWTHFAQIRRTSLTAEDLTDSYDQSHSRRFHRFVRPVSQHKVSQIRTASLTAQGFTDSYGQSHSRRFHRFVWPVLQQKVHRFLRPVSKQKVSQIRVTSLTVEGFTDSHHQSHSRRFHRSLTCEQDARSQARHYKEKVGQHLQIASHDGPAFSVRQALGGKGSLNHDLNSKTSVWLCKVRTRIAAPWSEQ